MNIVALIPARAGSKRIPGKNIKPLGGKPLIQWTIEAAQQSGIFFQIIASSEDEQIGALALRSGVGWHRRRPEHATDTSPDIDWVRSVLTPPCFDAFAILRPTSPFRTADTIRRALDEFQRTPCSSIRAVEPVKQHPGKMWQANGSIIEPLVEQRWWYPNNVPLSCGSTPWHSRPTQTLPTVYAQNASLEIAHAWCVTVFDSISGPKVAPFFTEGWEGFDVNTPEDWERAEAHAQTLLARV